jgi:hypothetical protein
MIMKT